ncbi:MAG: hypothetical protein M0Q95_08365 [Porticoccaceae bacterium]|nr:hypothetical protein [Porticoccaceae bacterium]
MGSTTRMQMARYELLADIAAMAAKVSSKYGLSAGVAAKAALNMSSELAANWVGQVFVIPKDMRWRRQARDERIHAEFTGSNHGDLAQRHNLTVNSIYKIIKARSQRQSHDVERSELLADVADHAQFIFESHGLQPEQAETAGSEVADALADAWGGQMFCVPHGMSERWQELVTHIHTASADTSLCALSAELDMPQVAIKKIVELNIQE